MTWRDSCNAAVRVFVSFGMKKLCVVVFYAWPYTDIDGALYGSQGRKSYWDL